MEIPGYLYDDFQEVYLKDIIDNISQKNLIENFEISEAYNNELLEYKLIHKEDKASEQYITDSENLKQYIFSRENRAKNILTNINKLILPKTDS